MTMTHRQLIDAGATYLRNECRCRPILREPVSSQEQPDILAFHTPDRTFVLEAKVSESDFRADWLKPFRLDGKRGMGVFRYYLCEKGLIEPFQLESRGWGLLTWQDGYIREALKPEPWHQRNLFGEVLALMQAVGNLEMSGARSADEARPSNANGLTAEDIAAVTDIVTADGPLPAKKIYSRLTGKCAARWKSGARFRNALERTTLPGIEYAEDMGQRFYRTTATANV